MKFYIGDLINEISNKTTPSALDDKINHALIKQAFHDSYDTIISAILSIFLIYFVLMFFNYDFRLHLWMILCVIYYAIRIALIYAYKNGSIFGIKVKNDQISSNTIILLALMTAASLLYLVHIVSTPPYSIQSHIVAALTLIMFSSAALISYSLVPKWLLTFLIALYLPLSIWFISLWDKNTLFPLLSFSIIFYVSYLGLISYSYYRVHYNSLRLQFQNNQFIKDMIYSKEKLQETNNNLSILNNELINEVVRRKKAEDILNKIISIDLLTGLTNRFSLLQQIDNAISNCQNNQFFGIIFIDLDRFKFINDTLGHEIGDNFLKVIAKRILHCTREHDTVSRIGGDEFVILVNNIHDRDHIIVVAQKILKELSQPYVIENFPIASSASMGISIFPSCGKDADTLIRNADTAMYRAKRQGGNSFFFYTDEMNVVLQKKIGIEKALRISQRENHFYLLYQPIIQAKTEKIIGLEALMRIKCHDGHSMNPDDFIPVAEEIGMIYPMGLWALSEACSTLNKLSALKLPPIKLAVNVSIKQIISNHFITDFKDIIKKSKIDPTLLEIEVTESMAMEHREYLVKILKQLTNLGITIVIDDFGTGHSSLSYLKDLPARKIKIDKSFTKDIKHNNENKMIISAILSLSKSFNLSVVAEGVENRDDFDYLAEQNCDFIQGYYFSKPISFKKAVDYIKKNSD